MMTFRLYYILVMGIEDQRYLFLTAQYQNIDKLDINIHVKLINSNIAGWRFKIPTTTYPTATYSYRKWFLFCLFWEVKVCTDFILKIDWILYAVWLPTWLVLLIRPVSPSLLCFKWEYCLLLNQEHPSLGSQGKC